MHGMARGYCNKHVQFHDLLASKVVRNPLKKNVVRNEILRFFIYIYIKEGTLEIESNPLPDRY
jgi:hypothetical protein